jgi:hypothetical protein
MTLVYSIPMPRICSGDGLSYSVSFSTCLFTQVSFQYIIERSSILEKQEVSILKTISYNRKQAMAFLSIVLIIVIVCSSPDMLSDYRLSGKHPVQAGSYESRHEFMLPISLPENQVADGILLAKTRFGPLQSRNRLMFILISRSILLFGCMELWKHNAFKFLQDVFHNKPELSLRIGGHAPPEARHV